MKGVSTYVSHLPHIYLFSRLIFIEIDLKSTGFKRNLSGRKETNECSPPLINALITALPGFVPIFSLAGEVNALAVTYIHSTYIHTRKLTRAQKQKHKQRHEQTMQQTNKEEKKKQRNKETYFKT